MNKLKICIIGCGGIGDYHLGHLTGFRDIIDIAGFCDIIEERAEAFRQKAGCGRVYTEYRKMLDTEKPDAVFVCVPPYCHGEIENDLIDRKIPFFVEKPVALTMEMACDIRDKVEKAKLITAVGFQCRYSSLVEPNRRFVEENKVLYVNCARFGGIPGVDWWLKKSTSGGQLVEQTIHQLDLMRWFCGEVDEVFAYNMTGFIKGVPGYDTDDMSLTSLKFKSGILGTIATGCYPTGGEAYDSKVTFSTADKRADLRILDSFKVYGEKPAENEGKSGLILANDGSMKASGDAVVYKETIPDAGVPSDRTFLEAVLNNDPSKLRTSYADAVKTLAVGLAANESMATGKAVKVRY